MTNVDFTDISIKTEPLSPESMEQVMASVATSPSSSSTQQGLHHHHHQHYHHQQQQQHQQQQPIISSSPLPPTPSSSYHNNSNNNNNTICSERKEYQNFHSSPMMSSGVVTTNPDFEQTTPTNPSTTATRSALKSSILNKRKARGETTPLSCAEDGPREYKLTKREIERKEARKEQNRRAARRCRIKKKRIQIQASQEMQTAIKENVDMKQIVDDLRQQVSYLQQVITEHEQTQHCKLSSCDASPHRLLDVPEPSHSNNKMHEDAKTKTSSCPATCVPVSPVPEDHNNVTSPTACSASAMSEESEFQELYSLLSIPSDCSDTLMTSQDSSTMENCNSSSSTVNGGFNCSNNNNNSNNSNCTDGSPCTYWDNSDNLQSEENSEDLNKIINAWCMNDFPTHRVEEEIMHYNPKNSAPLKSSTSKPPVVRNLNKYFNQTHPNLHEKQCQAPKKNNLPPPISLSVPERIPFSNDTIAQANHFLLDPSQSSPTLSCVPPNLVQQPSAFPIIPSTQNNANRPNKNNNSSNNNNNNTSSFLNQNAPHPLINSNNHYHYGDFAHNDHHDNHNGRGDSDILDELPMADIEALSQSQTSTSTPSSFSSSSSTSTSSSSSPFSPYRACQVLPPGAITLTDCCITTTTNNNNNNNTSNNINTTSNFSGPHHSPVEIAYQYQLSPISTPSPSSSTCTLSSPGFLHQASPHNLCPINDDNNNNNNNNNNNTYSDMFANIPVFNFDI